ncbi:hypothetical protein [Alteribacter natronophilus]|uniref:hypothetical protein n=1 Tax=Alteribacter natronophilus TaxID=2583810 RepID=UPI00110DE33B|nr:hypothetical protein [Alteribacter natronophilus]TMW72819.1 hypothetical protein FGB90_00455 [Alteribacter natronophilus]
MLVRINAVEEDGVFFHVSDPDRKAVAGFARKKVSDPGVYKLSVIGKGRFSADQKKHINEEIDRLFSRSFH